MTYGIYTCLGEIDEDNEDEIKGLEGTWYYNEDTKAGLRLKEELEELNFKVFNDTETDQDYQRRIEIAKIIDKDLSQVIGYPVTIEFKDRYGLSYYWGFDNDEQIGEWRKL